MMERSPRRFRNITRSIAVAVAAILLFLAWAVFAPYRKFGGETFVQLPRGAGSAGIAQALERAGVIRYSWAFLLERALRPSAKLQAGEYRFAQAASVGEVFGRIARGDIYYFEFTAPEGSNMFDIARSLEEKGVMTSAEFLEAASDPASIHDLAPHAQERCEGFSKGMRQKVALAGALIHEPRLIILDEPLTGLDAGSARQVKGVLRERVHAGGTVIMTTHILEVAERMADRIGVIAHGRLIAEGTLDELRLKAGKNETPFADASAGDRASLEDTFLALLAQPAEAA